MLSISDFDRCCSRPAPTIYTCTYFVYFFMTNESVMTFSCVNIIYFTCISIYQVYMMFNHNIAATMTFFYDSMSCDCLSPSKTRRWSGAVLMLAQRLRRQANIKTSLAFVLAGTQARRCVVIGSRMDKRTTCSKYYIWYTCICSSDLPPMLV